MSGGWAMPASISNLANCVCNPGRQWLRLWATACQIRAGLTGKVTQTKPGLSFWNQTGVGEMSVSLPSSPAPRLRQTKQRSKVRTSGCLFPGACLPELGLVLECFLQIDPHSWSPSRRGLHGRPGPVRWDLLTNYVRRSTDERCRM